MTILDKGLVALRAVEAGAHAAMSDFCLRSGKYTTGRVWEGKAQALGQVSLRFSGYEGTRRHIRAGYTDSWVKALSTSLPIFCPDIACSDSSITIV